MTREEIIEAYESAVFSSGLSAAAGNEEAAKDYDLLKAGLDALRPVSREQVEKVWKSEWIDNGERDPNGVPKTFAISCKRCGSSAGTSWMRFCPACGRAMTDEAAQMVMERLEALYGNRR